MPKLAPGANFFFTPSRLSAVAVSQSDAKAKDTYYPAGRLQLAALMIGVDKDTAKFHNPPSGVGLAGLLAIFKAFLSFFYDF